MASVVFMRGVNVGGHKAFRPSELARRLTALRVVSVGAAGTFVVGTDADESRIRSAFAKHLPFEATMMVCAAREITELARADPFAGQGLSKSDRPFICVVEKRPRRLPELPWSIPEGRDWQVKVIGVHGRFVATLMRKIGLKLLYPNEVVEKHFGVVATTRGWPTLVKICQVLESDSTAGGRRPGQGRSRPRGARPGARS